MAGDSSSGTASVVFSSIRKSLVNCSESAEFSRLLGFSTAFWISADACPFDRLDVTGLPFRSIQALENWRIVD